MSLRVISWARHWTGFKFTNIFDVASFKIFKGYILFGLNIKDSTFQLFKLCYPSSAVFLFTRPIHHWSAVLISRNQSITVHAYLFSKGVLKTTLSRGHFFIGCGLGHLMAKDSSSECRRFSGWELHAALACNINKTVVCYWRISCLTNIRYLCFSPMYLTRVPCACGSRQSERTFELRTNCSKDPSLRTCSFFNHNAHLKLWF